MRDDQFLDGVGAGAVLAGGVIFALTFTVGYSYSGGCQSFVLPRLPCPVIAAFYPVSGFLVLLGLALLLIAHFERRRTQRAGARPT